MRHITSLAAAGSGSGAAGAGAGARNALGSGDLGHDIGRTGTGGSAGAGGSAGVVVAALDSANASVIGQGFGVMV